MNDEDLKKQLLERAEEEDKKDPISEETQEEKIEDNSEDNDDNGADDLYVPNYVPGEVVKRSIIDEMKSNYLDYSMSVIVARALPENRDGLKPSQRRILVAMNDLSLSPSAHYRKSAKIAGDTSGNYHPHGESVVYPTMVKLAQDFSMRYPLVDGQGNFGSIDGDMPAAMRYTEARMSKITMQMLRDLEKGTVTFSPNYDSTKNEPNLLPSLFPNLLCNGSDGIAVGMATKIAPHNLSEVIDALREMIKRGNIWEGKSVFNELRKLKEKNEIIPKTLNSTPYSLLENYIDTENTNIEEKVEELKNTYLTEKEGITPELYPLFESDITTEELQKIIPGPDFPTGGSIYDKTEILNTYSTGRGRVLMRAKASIEEGKNGRFHIIVTELPYQVNKAHLIESIADLVKDKKIEGIADIRDESNREGMRIVIILKKDTQPKVVLNKLYKLTELQKAFNSNMIALVDGEPVTLNLKRILELFVTHRITITVRRYEFDLAQARYRAHILEGYLKALDLIDEVISTIRASKTQDDARENLISKFEFTTAQANAILEMQLRRLAALERQKLKDEYEEVSKNIAQYIKILEDDKEILRVIDTDLVELKEKYGDARRTKVYMGKVDDISEEDTVQEAQTFVTISRMGYIKRIPPETYRTQRRGGKGIIGATTKEDDYIQHALTCSTHDELFIFTNRGRIFTLKVYQIPEFSRTAKGLPIVNLIQIEQGEIVTSVLAKPKDTSKENKFLFMATKRGTVKKTSIEEFLKIRSSGIICIKLDSDDELKWVQETSGKDEILLVTKDGKCIRFSEEDVRPTGRNTRGVTGIRFKNKEDEVISMDVINESINSLKDARLFTLSELGFGKQSSLKEYDRQRRGGTGVFTFRVKPKTGKLVVAKIFSEDDMEIVVISTKGQVIRSGTSGFRVMGRQTSGVKVMNVHEDDYVAALAIMSNEE